MLLAFKTKFRDLQYRMPARNLVKQHRCIGCSQWPFLECQRVQLWPHYVK